VGNVDFHAPFAGLSFGGSNVKIAIGVGDPNVSDNVNADLAACAIGSLFLRTDTPDTTHALYVKTGANSISAPSGTWTPK
jgi:hypothetical protein